MGAGEAERGSRWAVAVGSGNVRRERAGHAERIRVAVLAGIDGESRRRVRGDMTTMGEAGLVNRMMMLPMP